LKFRFYYRYIVAIKHSFNVCSNAPKAAPELFSTLQTIRASFQFPEMINLKRKQTLSRHFRSKTISVWVRKPKHFRESAAHPVRVNVFRAFGSQVRGRTGEKKKNEREPHGRRMSKWRNQ
jgi:hypothetical protein